MISSLASIDIYVSVNGSDAASGTIAAPVRTPHHALELVRALRSQPATPATIWLESGEYYIGEAGTPLSLGPDDSNLSLRGLSTPPPVLSGGVRLDCPWKPPAAGSAAWTCQPSAAQAAALRGVTRFVGGPTHLLAIDSSNRIARFGASVHAISSPGL